MFNFTERVGPSCFVFFFLIENKVTACCLLDGKMLYSFLRDYRL